MVSDAARVALELQAADRGDAPQVRLLLCADCDALRYVDVHGRCESCGSGATFQRDGHGAIKRLLALEDGRREKLPVEVKRRRVVVFPGRRRA